MARKYNIESPFMNKFSLLLFISLAIISHETHAQASDFSIDFNGDELKSINVKGAGLLFKRNRLFGFFTNDSSLRYNEEERRFVFYGIYIGPKNDSLLTLDFEENTPVTSYKNYRKVLEPTSIKPGTGTIDTMGVHGFVYGWDNSDVRIIYNNAYIDEVEINKNEKKLK